MVTQAKSRAILGYTLQEQLGSGGYGEVWSAEAPGGLPKAIKLVYGFHDEHRAQTELKALEKIKQIRHPFLLSLERIDIVEGQLVIVSELADGCLNDVHRKYIQKGMEGIPRDELLVYMNDAAEALDYLSNNFSLQHLDVKPENLLVVGDHVKLADFGLVKDVNVTNQSMVTGMTPIYAAPELFDGRPDAKSDQYSLAVVYQEMLTSSRPFDGETTAQLAAQHLGGRPDLRALPKSDQHLVAKALAKDPKNRFSSCQEFISELKNRRIRKKSVSGIQKVQRAGESDSTDIRDQTIVVSDQLMPFHQKAVEKLPPPEFDPACDWLQPTLVVAIGGSAVRTAQQLKSKIIGRHGQLQEIPSFRLVCIDTDETTFNGLNAATSVSGLNDEESLCLKLKTPEYYRTKTTTTLSWLSRRWIYNIPKNRKTEGVRPLGRLAFADHFDQVCDALREAIESITRLENVAKTAEKLDANPPQAVQPRIQIVCSMNGGASGMLFDIGYLLRTLLIEEGFNSDSINAVLTHSLGSRATKAELSTANALATFSELRHFVDYGYPGDDSLGIPPFEDAPFEHVYFHELGADFANEDIQQQIGEVSEWIYMNSLSPTSRFFDACRNDSLDSNSFELRTFGMKVNGPTEKRGTFELANQMIADLIHSWTSGLSIQQNGKECACSVTFNVDRESLLQCVKSVVESAEGREQIAGTMSRIKEESITAENTKLILREQFDALFGIPAQHRSMSYEPTLLESQIKEQIDAAIFSYREEFENRLTEELKKESLRLKPIRNGFQNFVNCAEKIGEEFEQQAEESDLKSKQTIDQIVEALHLKTKNFDLAASLEKYCNSRVDNFIFRNMGSLIEGIVQATTDFDNWLEEQNSSLSEIRGDYCFDADPDQQEENQSFTLINAIEQHLKKALPEIQDRFEHEFFKKFVDEVGGFETLLRDPNLIHRAMPEKLRNLSLELASLTWRSIKLDEVFEELNLEPGPFLEWLDEQAKAAMPVTDDVGGCVRLMVATPELGGPSKLSQTIEQQLELKPIDIAGTYGDLILCFEGSGLSLAAVAARMISERPRALELGTRLLCRQDVKWSKLQELID